SDPLAGIACEQGIPRRPICLLIPASVGMELSRNFRRQLIGDESHRNSPFVLSHSNARRKFSRSGGRRPPLVDQEHDSFLPHGMWVLGAKAEHVSAAPCRWSDARRRPPFVTLSLPFAIAAPINASPWSRSGLPRLFGGGSCMKKGEGIAPTRPMA